MNSTISTCRIYFHFVFNLRIVFGYIKECVRGWFGQNCKQQCSGYCRDSNVCNHVTGQCDGGCAAGWRGTLCDKGLPI